MLEMLKERKATLEAQGKKGFTLMEMLIVIAIIAILIAIAIPLFTSQMDQAKHATNESNARSVYSIAMADYMDNSIYDNGYVVGTDTITVKVTGEADQVFKFDILKSGGTFTVTDGTNALPTSSGGTTKATGAPIVTVEDNISKIVFPQSS